MNGKFDRIIFSPHLDDAVLSCGGILAKLKRLKKKTLVVTVFSQGRDKVVSPDGRSFIKKGGFTSAHDMFNFRKREDSAAANLLKFSYLHLKYVDAIFRHPKLRLVFSGQLHHRDYHLITFLSNSVTRVINRYAKEGCEIYFPLGLGGHIDHVLLNKVGQTVPEKKVYFYEDFPYLLYLESQIKLKEITNQYCLAKRVDLGDNIFLKEKAINAYSSQLVGLFSRRVRYTPARENYYQKLKKNYIPPHSRLVCLSDDLAGGGKVVNENLYHEFSKILEPNQLVIFEQVPPPFKGVFSGTTKNIWSVLNFMLLIKAWSIPGVIFYVTSANALIAFGILSLFKGKNNPIYYYNHYDLKAEITGGLGGLYQFLYYFSYRFFLTNGYRFINKVFVPSKKYIHRLSTHYSGVLNRNKIVHIPHGVNQQIFHPISPNLHSDSKVIVYSGRLDPLKGIDHLISSLPLINVPVKLSLIILCPSNSTQNNRYYRHLLETAKKITTPQIIVSFYHPPDYSAIANYYHVADCVILPSADENSPMALWESLSCGTIFVGTPKGDMADTLAAIDPRLIIRRRTPTGIAKALKHALNLNQSQKQRLIKSGFKFIKDRSWSVSAKAIIGEINLKNAKR